MRIFFYFLHAFFKRVDKPMNLGFMKPVDECLQEAGYEMEWHRISSRSMPGELRDFVFKTRRWARLTGYSKTGINYMEDLGALKARGGEPCPY